MNMTKVITAFLILSVSHLELASSYTIDDLTCESSRYGLSCVSTASIERDKAELELIKLQIEEIKKKNKKTKEK